MKINNYLTISILTLISFSCVQDYPNEFKDDVEKLCECMKVRKTKRREVIEAVESIYEDKDYEMCILDPIIEGIDTKGNEFSNAIDHLCPNLTETHKRYKNSL